MGQKLYDKFKEKQDRQAPGPGQYQLTLKAKNQAPVYGIGTSKRMDPSKVNSTPGVETDAGKYNPGMTQTKTASPNFRFGSSQRSMLNENKMK